ncbi:NAD(P)H-dependent oxidoreductase [Phormidium tenue FACHB-886]|nr:NAD(P)H-dependent oxidoreductase [Phormidium tenue FACHB-886]
MVTILQVDSSPRSDCSISRALTKQLLQTWQHTYPAGRVNYRDVGRFPVPPIDEAWIAAAFTPPHQLNLDLQTALKISDELIDELLAADFLVFGIPMYNYSVPANFKAYIDQIVRVRRTFAIDSDRYEGLVNGKKAVVITTRGGSYAGSSLDFQEPYLRAVFEFIGITDIAFIHAENLAMRDEERQGAIAAAHTAIQQVVASWQYSYSGVS